MAVITFPASGSTAPNGATPSRVSREGDRTVVWLEGEHDIATVFDLAETLASAIALDDADLVIDLTGAQFISAATINVFLGGRRFLRTRSRSLTLRSPSRSARRILDACGLADLIDPQSTVSSMLRPVPASLG